MTHHRHHCTLDPITLTGLALAAGGAAAGFGASKLFSSGGSAPTAAPTPSAPPPPASVPAQQQPQTKPSFSNTQQQSFLGAAATPAVAGSGQKTLLGQ